jgi:tRNA (Thr-GGU) A37 N-methylase
VTVVELVKVEDGRLYVKGFDAYEETPVIDIKSA